tara:strand:- start:3300 stop:4790 length:1491 start_codon:yes stop_codon:yes gene_type:complete
MISKNMYLVVLLFCFYSSLKAECTTETLGLCTEGTTTEITNTEIIDTIVENKDSGNLLDGNNGFVSNTKEGDMDFDWGGQGSASMPTGNSCYGLGTDRCAEITDSNLTTFYQQIDISSLNINHGGETNYTIKVDKQDAQDNIYMKITGKNGSTQIFTGTDVLSATGVTSGYQSYSGGFDFGGSLTNLIVEVGGQDINLQIGVLFDDVEINVLYNVVTLIINQQIQDLEEFLVLEYDQESNDVAEMIFETNEVNNDFGNFTLEPIDEPMGDLTIETIEMEMEFEMNFDFPETMEAPMEMANLEMEMELELDLPDIENVEIVEIEVETENIEQVEPEQTTDEVEKPNETVQEEVQEPEQNEVEETQEETEEPIEVAKQEPEQEVEETQEEKAKEEETKEEPKKIVNQKQKAANKIVKKMGDKGKYETNNQTKTLIVMQVLGNTKDFFNVTAMIQDKQGFFNNSYLPDTTISDNNMASYLLFGGSEYKHNEFINSQYER